MTTFIHIQPKRADGFDKIRAIYYLIATQRAHDTEIITINRKE